MRRPLEGSRHCLCACRVIAVQVRSLFAVHAVDHRCRDQDGAHTRELLISLGAMSRA